MRKKQSGFTLIEMMVVVAIIGIMAAIAAPSYGRMMARSEVNTVIGQWRDSFFLAQTEALRLKHRVTLCPSIDGETCTGNDYSKGWIVLDQSAKPKPRLIQDFPPTPAMNSGEITLTLKAASELKFLYNGRLPSNFAGGNITATYAKHNVESGLVISRAGRVRSK